MLKHKILHESQLRVSCGAIGVYCDKLMLSHIYSN